MNGYWDRDGAPISQEQWVALRRSTVDGKPYKVVACTDTPGGLVSTVWLGDDWGHGSDVPIIFETQTFGGESGDEGERYATEAEALAGHERYVRRAHNAQAELVQLASHPTVAAAVLSVDVALANYRDAIDGRDPQKDVGGYASLLAAVRQQWVEATPDSGTGG